MASENKLAGAEFVMVDGAALVTEVITESNRLRQCVSMIFQDMIEHQDMVAGLDITWIRSNSKHPEDDIALLAICTRIGCILVSTKNIRSGVVRELLGDKNITFAGVHMKENAKRLKKLHMEASLDITNAVDLGELAVDALRQPRLRSVGVRRLASEVLLLPFKLTPYYWIGTDDLKPEEIECVATDAYTSYKLGTKLLGF